MTQIADSLEAVIGLLKADAGVSALVSTRVYGYELPPAKTDDMESSGLPQKCIVVVPSGGVAGPYMHAPMEQRRLDTYCYGDTLYEADKVRRAVFDALRTIRRTTYNSDIVIHSATPAGGAMSGRDPETDWPVHWNSWQVLSDTRNVA